MKAAPCPAAAWLALALTPGLTPAVLRRLVAVCGSAAAIVDSPAPLLARIVGENVARAIARGPDPQRLDAALAWAAIPGCHLVAIDDERYPQILRELQDAPALLYARGRADLLRAPSIAVVGSRSGTVQGARNATSLARALSDAGLCIVSGLAQGIDAAAHRGGLDGLSSSIAVLGTGIDRVYPPRHKALATELSERGLLVTEYALGTPALAQNFPRRNRIISGLVRGCVVIEAALASGSLITARLAAEQGREVFAVPGSIHSPLSKGCHQLIKQGAKLVESAEDVLEELGAQWQPRLPLAPPADASLSQDARALLAHIGHEPLDTDSLAACAGVSIEHANAVLLELELAGVISVLAGNRIQRLN